jgi:hypothetical protein
MCEISSLDLRRSPRNKEGSGGGGAWEERVVVDEEPAEDIG